MTKKAKNSRSMPLSRGKVKGKATRPIDNLDRNFIDEFVEYLNRIHTILKYLNTGNYSCYKKSNSSMIYTIEEYSMRIHPKVTWKKIAQEDYLDALYNQARDYHKQVYKLPKDRLDYIESWCKRKIEYYIQLYS